MCVWTKASERQGEAEERSVFQALRSSPRRRHGLIEAMLRAGLLGPRDETRMFPLPFSFTPPSVSLSLPLCAEQSFLFRLERTDHFSGILAAVERFPGAQTTSRTVLLYSSLICIIESNTLDISVSKSTAELIIHNTTKTVCLRLLNCSCLTSAWPAYVSLKDWSGNRIMAQLCPFHLFFYFGWIDVYPKSVKNLQTQHNWATNVVYFMNCDLHKIKSQKFRHLHVNMENLDVKTEKCWGQWAKNIH